MTAESFLASLVCMLLSLAGITAIPQGPIIYIPSINHRFIIAPSCLNWNAIFLFTFLFILFIWVYTNIAELPITRRTYGILSATAFPTFFLTNILRMFTEIYLAVEVYSPADRVYLFNTWQAFEDMVGATLMFCTLSLLLSSSIAILRRGTPIKQLNLDGVKHKIIKTQPDGGGGREAYIVMVGKPKTKHAAFEKPHLQD